MITDQWYYTDALNNPTGPYPFSELNALAKAGTIQPDTLVCKAGDTGWRRFDSVQISVGGPVVPPLPPPLNDAATKKDFFIKLGLTILICCPIGIIWVLYSKKLSRRQKWFIGVVSFFWFMLGYTPMLGGIIAGVSEGTHSTYQYQNSMSESEGEPSNNVSSNPDDAVAKIEKLMQNKFRKRLKDVDVTTLYDESGYNVKVRFQFADPALRSLYKHSADQDMIDAYEALYQSGMPIQQVTMFMIAPTIDGYGNESEALVYKTQMTREIAEQVNWKNKELIDFRQIWETQQRRPEFD